MMHRVNSSRAGCTNWGRLSRQELEKRFNTALEMLRRIASGRIAWDIRDVQTTIKSVTSFEMWEW